MTWNTTTDPDSAIQDWSEAYKELCTLILAKVPEKTKQSNSLAFDEGYTLFKNSIHL